MISVSGIALKFQTFCMKTTPCQKPNLPSYSLIPKPELNIWGHDQARGQSKTSGRAGSMIPFLRNYWAKLATLEIKGRRTKKYDDIKSFLRVKITRYDSSKQEQKEPSKLTIRLKLLRKGELHEEKGTYISQVSIHAY